MKNELDKAMRDFDFALYVTDFLMIVFFILAIAVMVKPYYDYYFGDKNDNQ